MRFGCCLNMIAGPDDPIGMDKIEIISAAGFDYIELPLAQISELDEAEFNALTQRVAESGIGCEACNNTVPPYVKLTGPEADFARIKDFFNRALERAAALGASYVGIGSPAARNFPEGFPQQKALSQLADAFRLAGDIGAKLGVKINIEPINKKECNLINTVDECVELHKELGHENIGMIIDYYHLATDCEPAENIARMGKNLTHTHIASRERRLFPSAHDSDDYRPFFNTLISMGYDSRLSIEAYAKNLEQEAKTSLEFFRASF